MASRTNPTILTIAHRGLWKSTAENSLASIREAIAQGVDMVEIDTQASADGHLVVIHDATLDRTTTGSRTVSDLPFDVIRQAKLRSGAGGPEADITEECVPTLEEILEEARGRITVNIDTKFTRDLPQVMETVLRMNIADQVLVKTDIDLDADHFAITDADWFGKIPHMPMFPVRPGRFTEDLRRIESLKAPMIEVKFTDLADIADARAELDRQNIRVWINTLDVSHCLDFNDTRALADPDGVWTVLADAGVGAIQTDEVEAFKAWLHARQA
ncbi:glycerophosphodiester phosphodiesterase [Agrobacterium vitis]|uniref:Glycerophosphodiester phosphodiesterase n=2 Tax=Agrobacterium vitis TaxID=373 RepID=A0AAE4WBY6_AGRVI|nr:glycerophosphodiester phosphodiesterase family protein [Allorhizobium sp. Av2]MUZ57290.1 glycerophosphodiester phosphodiesterase [Agrobacterium vitis]MVA65599.1 glycerophosphodiester phosphodiesterase [Agrobacterium vitis]MVA86624.1 glycerophosphodiester phosphodiesterase [Agrobacterium vitis]